MGSARFLFVTFALAGTLSAQRVGEPTDDLTQIGIDELFSLEVTSAGRKAQQLSKAPAAVYVLTAEDIRRSGANSIPEALQWVPGLTVSHLDGRSWMISARGSTRLFADKILVMIDGRSLYTPLFSGVIWDSIDVPLENIERIEVVLGPGSVMWGPNAVNGVINIITKSSRATKGAQVSAASGNELHGSLMTRWGDTPSDNLSYRFWGKVDDENPAYGSPGYYAFNNQYAIRDPRPVTDLHAEAARFGFRVDDDISAKDQIMIQGDVFTTGRQDPFSYPVFLPGVIDRVQSHSGYDGGFLQASWTHTSSAGNESTLQFSFDGDEIDYAFLGGQINNLTLDYQNRRQTSERNEIYWGAGFQQYWDSTQSQRFAAFVPSSTDYRAGDVVLRDEFQIIPDRLMVSAGMRTDYTSWTRFEFQPSLRLLYTPSSRQSLWVAASRAVRVPSRYDRDLESDAGIEPLLGYLVAASEVGSHSMRSEHAVSLETGYRFQAGQRWSAEASVFWTYYGNLRILQFPAHPQVEVLNGMPVLILPLAEVNAGTGRNWGGELSGTWQVLPRWRLIPSWWYLNQVRWSPGPLYQHYVWDTPLNDPAHQGFLRSQFDLTRRLQLDLMGRARTSNSGYDVPGSVIFDARLGYHPWRNSELSFDMQDVLDRHVLDTYTEAPFVAIPLRRTFVVRWRQSF